MLDQRCATNYKHYPTVIVKHLTTLANLYQATWDSEILQVNDVQQIRFTLDSVTTLLYQHPL